MIGFRDLPDPLQERILEAASNSARPETLLHLACVDKGLAEQLKQSSANVWWDAAWAAAKRKRPAAAAEGQKADPALTIKTRDLLRLAGFNGCMLCGAKAIRKVYWEFSIRCCRDCLLKHSIAENTLKHTFALQPATFQHLPHRLVEMYKPRAGSFSFNTYWKAHFVPILQEQHGVQSFEEYTQRQEQQEQTKQSKRQDRSDQLQEWCKEEGIDLTQADQHSSTYKRNCRLAVPLKRKAFEQLQPRIESEIDQGATEAAAKKQRLEESQLSPSTSAKPSSETTSSKQLQLQRKQKQVEETKQFKLQRKQKQMEGFTDEERHNKNQTCTICGGHRLFSVQGLRDHTKAKHP